MSQAIRDQLPIETLGTESLVIFPGRQHPHIGRKSVLEEVSMSCETTRGEDSEKLMPGFLWTTLYLPFSFDDFALHSFPIINPSCKYDFMLSLESPRESTNLRDPQHSDPIPNPQIHGLL